MARPLISTKLFIPRARRHVVTRPRLLDRLRRGTESRLTLVSAPAGFGKTTLLAEWLGGKEEDHRRIAWFSLDAADSDPASFWTYVVSALQKAVPGVGGSALELIALSDVSTESVLTMVLNDLAMAPDDVWLVLDDYHLVDSHEVANGMVVLLDHLPSHVHVMISTRTDPELPGVRTAAADTEQARLSSSLVIPPQVAGGLEAHGCHPLHDSFPPRRDKLKRS